MIFYTQIWVKVPLWKDYIRLHSLSSPRGFGWNPLNLVYVVSVSDSDTGLEQDEISVTQKFLLFILMEFVLIAGIGFSCFMDTIMGAFPPLSCFMWGWRWPADSQRCRQTAAIRCSDLNEAWLTVSIAASWVSLAGSTG